MDTTVQMTKLDHPVDVMYLIHKALRGEANRLEAIVEDLETGGSLQTFNLAFNALATALMFHSDQEDSCMSTHLAQSHPLGCSESDHAKMHQHATCQESYPEGEDSASLLSRVRSALIAQEEESHHQLLDTIQDIMTVMEEDIGASSIIPRTKQHLFRQVVFLRIALEDHLETEEALVVPLMREQMNGNEQLGLAKALLLDESAQDPRWMIDWINQHLDAAEQALLADLETRF